MRMVRGRGGGGIYSYDSPVIGLKSSGSGSFCQDQRWEEEHKSLTLSCLHTMCPPHGTLLYWALQWPWEITFIGKPGWVTGRQSAVQLAWTSNLHSDACETLLPKNTLISKSIATALIPFQGTDRGRSHSWRQPMVWLWEEGPLWVL